MKHTQDLRMLVLLNQIIKVYMSCFFFELLSLMFHISMQTDICSRVFFFFFLPSNNYFPLGAMIILKLINKNLQKLSHPTRFLKLFKVSFIACLKRTVRLSCF